LKRILIVSQYFYPDTFKINEIAVELVNAGYKVDVVTGLPDYPSGIIPTAYKKGKKRNENYRGVTIHRVSTVARKSGPIFRALNYLSFAINAARYIKSIKNNYDNVFVYQLSPVTMIYPALKATGRKVVYCMDIWPEAVKAMHINESNPIYGIIHKISSNLYNSVDKVAVSSYSFIDYLIDENSVPLNRMTYLPQHSDDMILADSDNLTKLLKDDQKFHFIFTGNIGNVQDVETIIRAASQAKKSNEFVIDIVGDGSNYSNMQFLAKKLKAKNIVFHGRQPYSLMAQYYYESDCCLLTLRNDNKIGLTIPAKLQAYMSSGRPILAALEGDSRKIINEAQCGKVVHASAIRELADEMDNFLNYSKTELADMGKNARNYYLNNFTMKEFITNLIRIFEGEIENGN